MEQVFIKALHWFSVDTVFTLASAFFCFCFWLLNSITAEIKCFASLVELFNIKPQFFSDLLLNIILTFAKAVSCIMFVPTPVIFLYSFLFILCYFVMLLDRWLWITAADTLLSHLGHYSAVRWLWSLAQWHALGLQLMIIFLIMNLQIVFLIKCFSCNVCCLCPVFKMHQYQ